MKKILVVGRGSAGSRFARHLSILGSEVSFLRSGNAHPDLPQPEARYETFWTTTTAGRWDPDGVIVATPTAMHIPDSLFWVREGVPVLVEKPISDSSNSLETLRDALRSPDYPSVWVAYQMRFHSKTSAARAFVDEYCDRDLLATFQWSSNAATWHPWERERFWDGYAFRRDLGGGSALTMSHELDLALYLFGAISVATGTRYYPSRARDQVDFVFEQMMCHENGAKSFIHTDFWGVPERRTLTIAGGDVSTSFDFLADPQAIEDSYVTLARSFLTAIDGESTELCTLDEAEEIVRIIENTTQVWCQDE